MEPGKPAYEKEIENTLESIQEEVGGGIFQVLYMDDGAILCYNDEGKLLGMEMNRRLYDDIICGPFFMVGDGGVDFVSLSDEQLAAAGIDGGLIRLSVGLESVEDIIADIERGFAAIN